MYKWNILLRVLKFPEWYANIVCVHSYAFLIEAQCFPNYYCGIVVSHQWDGSKLPWKMPRGCSYHAIYTYILISIWNEMENERDREMFREICPLVPSNEILYCELGKLNRKLYCTCVIACVIACVILCVVDFECVMFRRHLNRQHNTNYNPLWIYLSYHTLMYFHVHIFSFFSSVFFCYFICSFSYSGK